MNGRKVLSRLGWAYTVFFLASTAVQYLIVLASAAAPEPWQKFLWNDNVTMILSQASMYLAGFPLCFLTLRRLPAWHRPGDRRIRGMELFFLAVFCMGFAYMGNLLGSVLASVWDMTRGVQSTNPVSDVIQTLNPAVMIFTTVVIAPLMEELLFRKLLIDRLIPYGQPLAVIISGVSFGLYHGNLFQFFYACMLGMIFAYLYSSTGKLRYNVVLHMIINLTGGVIPLLLVRGANAFPWISIASGPFLVSGMAVSIIGAVVMACMWLPKLSWTRAWGWKEGERGLSELCKAPGVWVFLAVCAVQFLFS